MSDSKDFTPKSFIDQLSGRMKAAETEAAKGSGQSDVLYESRVQAAYEALLNESPDSEKDKVFEILSERGYEPDFEPYQAEEDECSLTGINTDCCPCGQHP